MATEPKRDTIPDLLVRNVPRETLMGIEEALVAGAQRAYASARGMAEGHLPHVVGQLRHFHMNESFHRALAAGGEVVGTNLRVHGGCSYSLLMVQCIK